MKPLVAIAVLAAAVGAAPVMTSPIWQSFDDRAAALAQRIESAQGLGRLAPGQQTLLKVQLDAARSAERSGSSQAAAMLDVIDRQVAQVDRGLSRAEDGQTIVAHVGDDVTIGMHDPYIYNVELAPQSLLVIHPGVMWVRGVQGVYTAKAPGTVSVTVTPRPGVNPAPPPALSQPVRFTVVILPAAQR
ncbi:MAG TPA: hypothetical protein VFA29_05500 [Candidatus Baltobacteraceae bacterium]|nr:hypothetical protein [Candidatus Baltobacteraceae bacterium]